MGDLFYYQLLYNNIQYNLILIHLHPHHLLLIGAQYNINGLLARSVLTGCSTPAEVPRLETFDASGRISYTNHWIGKTWNGDGLNEVLDPRLQLEDFTEVVYGSSNASWVSLQRKRSNSAADLLSDVRHEWHKEGERKQDPKKKRPKPRPRPRRGVGETKLSTTPP